MRFAAYISSFILVVAAALSTSSFYLFTMRKKTSSFLFLSSLLSSSFANGETLQCFAHPETGETTCTEGGQVLNDDSLEDQQQGNESRNNNNEDPNCKDHHELCSFWASKGECEKNPDYMRLNCQISCNTCKNKKQGTSPEKKAKRTSKLSSRDSKLLEGTTEFGEKQEASGDQFEATMDVIEKSTLYMSRDLKDLSPKVIEQCKNRHKVILTQFNCLSCSYTINTYFFFVYHLFRSSSFVGVFQVMCVLGRCVCVYLLNLIAYFILIL